MKLDEEQKSYDNISKLEENLDIYTNQFLLFLLEIYNYFSSLILTNFFYISLDQPLLVSFFFSCDYIIIQILNFMIKIKKKKKSKKKAIEAIELYIICHLNNLNYENCLNFNYNHISKLLILHITMKKK